MSCNRGNDMRKHRDDPDEPTLNAGENFSRATRAISSSWVVWPGTVYTFVAMYLVFRFRPIGSLLGLPPALEWLVLELAVWIVLPFAVVLFVRHRLTS